MNENIISLNGFWRADYLSDAPYTATVEPMTDAFSHTVTELSVPGYWEDMTEQLAASGLYQKMNINPLYEEQSYPQTGYCKDMFLPNVVGCLVYTKTFEFSHSSQNTALYIGGAQNTVSAWLNGRYLGCHQGYSTPFMFSIPDGVLIPGENRITLAVSNNRLEGYLGRPVSGLTSRAANECTGGIYGDVELRCYPDGLQDVWVTVSEDLKSVTVHTEGAADQQKKISVFYGEKCICKTSISAGNTTATLNTKEFHRWSPDTPELYQVVVETENQTISRSFGVRRLMVDGTRLLLNGEPFYFRGVCEHCYQYATVHPTRDKNYYIAVIQKLKSLGFNSIRFHTWIPPYEYMEAADELGMLLEVESPNNTALAEWEELVRFCRRHPSVNLYSTGNELQIDCNYEKHLADCAKLVHTQTDGLFSPMSAMRGIEYMLTEEDPRVSEPFVYNPERLSAVGQYSDVYNSYSLGATSYDSSFGTQAEVDKRNGVYGKPLLSHEICIQGTYIDLSLEEKYKNTRIGKTQFMSSVRTHLAEKGLLDRAELYYQNSSKWQSLLRKQCFELVRRCETFAGYDFLGDIDTHWHTFGYCVGMMNEFYELKPGETTENVLRYNSPTVLLADIPRVNLEAGEKIEIPIWASHYGHRLQNAKLHICVRMGETEIIQKDIFVGRLDRGELRQIDCLRFSVPECADAAQIKLSVELTEENVICSNCWDLYVFPKTEEQRNNGDEVVICNGCSIDVLEENMQAGKTVVIFGTEPFASCKTTFQLSIAGRTTGHLATVIAKHPLTDRFPHEGFCARQFEGMLNGGSAAILDGTPGTHSPIIDIATTYKNAQREALLFEFGIGSGRLLVCTLNLDATDPGARWLKKQIISYANSSAFAPSACLTVQELRRICAVSVSAGETDSNRAMNRNDITACKV